ncbi:LamG-like jellyroll fold domain-containing protein [Rhodopirellula sp. SWK7]|uniref:LamG-like jellyroll fold domain-containing protein n=1 Tax=Rhodopirellula sp. SWK7 TaxID=595460 RepID=UPI0002BDB5F0|nr:LamG-like jellyroll fold domain-containing protein [Rhodopirellula sp. SWK7]EMI47079.1 FecR protein domain protein [Rhodopirellula sp. SWK7]
MTSEGKREDNEFDQLLQLALEGTLTREQAMRVQEMVRRDPARLEVWVDYFRLDSMLSEELDGAAIVDLVDWVCQVDEGDTDSSCVHKAVAEQPTKRSRAGEGGTRWRDQRWSVGLVASAAIAVLFLANWQRRAVERVSVMDAVAVSFTANDAIAMLTQASGDVWQDGETPPMQLSPGRLRLESGLAEIRVYNGVTLYLEGPVDLDLVSLDQAHLRNGKLRAIVPDGAEGYTVTTESVRLVDRGTEFAIASTGDGVSRVHVIDGLVDLYPKGASESAAQSRRKAVLEGESVEISSEFEMRETTLDLDGFPSASAIDRSVSDQYQRWRSWSEAFSKRSDLLLYFNFEGKNKQMLAREGLANLAASQRENVKATVVGCELLDGRWPQKRALGFYNTADRIRIRVPGRFPHLTFACWVRIDELKGVNQALLLTDDFDDWRPHWQIAKEGDLKLGIGQSTRAQRRQMRSGSQHLASLSPLGRWTHLATTYDADSKLVRHYVNGEQAAWNELPRAEPLHIGAAEIGNWLRPRKTGDEPIRNLDGRIDEFMLLRSVLDADAIREIYDVGR